MDFDILAVGAGAIVVLVALFAVWRTGDISLKAVAGKVTDIQTAVGAAREWVLAAEQLYQTGKLSKEGRMVYVLDKLKQTFPSMEESTLVASIEAAVAWMKLLRGNDA